MLAMSAFYRSIFSFIIYVLVGFLCDFKKFLLVGICI
jgi:hypothetical protein